MAQIKTKTVTVRGVMRSAAFVRGFNESVNDVPFDYESYGGMGSDRWDYERGRLFGKVFKGPLKFGRTTNPAAVYACSVAIRDRIIV